MGNQTPKSLPADRRSIRSRQSSGRTTYQRTGRRSTPGRASSVPISSGSPVNALGSEPGPQTSQPAPYTRRNTSFDPDDLRSPRPSAAFSLNATPEREFDPDSDLADYEDTPGRTASNGVLPPLVSPRPPPSWVRSPSRNTPGAASISRTPSPTSPNYNNQGPPQEDPEEEPPREDDPEEQLYDDDDPCRDVLIERDNLLIERDDLLAEALRFDAERFVFRTDIDRMRDDRVDLNMRLRMEQDERDDLNMRLRTEQDERRELSVDAEITATTIQNLRQSDNDLRDERDATQRETERIEAIMHRRINDAHQVINRLGGEIPQTPERLSASPEPPQEDDEGGDDDDPCREVRRERDAAVRANQGLRDRLALARADILRLHEELRQAGGRQLPPPRRPSPRRPARGSPVSPTHRPPRGTGQSRGPRGGRRGGRGPAPPPAPTQAGRRVTRGTATADEVAQLTDFRSPETRCIVAIKEAEAAARAAAKPKGVSKTKGVSKKKGKGRKK